MNVPMMLPIFCKKEVPGRSSTYPRRVSVHVDQRQTVGTAVANRRGHMELSGRPLESLRQNKQTQGV